MEENIPGSAEGEALVSSMGISFYGGIDPQTGQVVEKSHALEGQSIGGKVLVFPTGKGSTVGSYTLYRLRKPGRLLRPFKMLNPKQSQRLAAHSFRHSLRRPYSIEQITTGMKVRVDAEAGTVEIL